MTSLAQPVRSGSRRPCPQWDGTVVPYKIEEHRWGFRVGPRQGEGTLARVARVIATVTGAAAAAGALSLLWPMAGEPPGTFPLRVGLAALIGGGGILLLWFASRGTAVEAEVDSSRGEIRLVVRNLLGGPTLVAALGFDAVRGAPIERSFGGRGLAVLSLALADGTTVPVATGSEAALAPLRRRIERDILVGVQKLSRGQGEGLAAFELRAA